LSASTQTQTPAVELRGLGKTFGSVTALEDVSLSIAKGELVSLLGASGSGKSTLLRLIAGFDTPTSGRVILGGTDVSRVSPAGRGIGMVFQNYALFPHLSVRRNIEYGLRMRGWRRLRRRERADEMLARMRLDAYGDRLPRELSGGQQQRVAIARALAFSPELLLMDEPLGALDKALKEDLLEEIRRVHREFATTIVYVTHDREEALVLSDRIALMDAARLQVCEPVEELFLRPPSAFAARFISGANIFPFHDGPFALLHVDGDRAVVGAAGCTFDAHASGSSPEALAVRPAGFRLVPPATAAITGTLTELVFLGDEVRLRVSTAERATPVIATFPTETVAGLREGESVGLDVEPSLAVAVAG
jgi:ABC-type spermidine/putrescine transport systems, ATPase components